jgi:glycogen(starch) synthase
MENLDEIKEHITESVCSGELPTKTKVFDEPFLLDLKQMIARIRTKRGKDAPVSAMEIEGDDAIMKMLAEQGLDNKVDDRVKVVYYPTYLSPADGLINLNYNEAIMGCHLGIFPSYYEPWGYTPVETAALAVPSVTTDLAGFGEFIRSYVRGPKAAICVLERKAKGDEAATQQLVEYMHFLLNTDKKERVAKKIEAKRLSEFTDWQSLIKNYIDAYALALRKAAGRTGS